jgi:hypothetical protein
MGIPTRLRGGQARLFEAFLFDDRDQLLTDPITHLPVDGQKLLIRTTGVRGIWKAYVNPFAFAPKDGTTAPCIIAQGDDQVKGMSNKHIQGFRLM